MLIKAAPWPAEIGRKSQLLLSAGQFFVVGLI